jgi:hypothetical protein
MNKEVEIEVATLKKMNRLFVAVVVGYDWS